ncbi:hypothetical protein Tsubulata_032304 [Turnera subulata]|uniref:RING-type E3 ubiquitin transferase n=1 Tax=Turnera subulata TaxID=218843 RepID=A0A9Q0FUN4_9ROSI|nr:hypothetical protein Tsubulata_032304 [Turnera subulata]
MSSTDPKDPMYEFDVGDNGKGYALSGKIMLSAIVILFFVVVLMVCLHLYARWYLLRARRRHHTRRARARRTTQLVFYIDPSNPNAGAAAARTAARGLDKAVLNSLPLFVYSPETHPDPIECAVCLSEFEERETGRVLPKCKHSFHIECIDMWFHSHSTCPLCRCPVEAAAPPSVPESHPVEEATGPAAGGEPGPCGAGLCVMCRDGEGVSVGGGGGGGGAASTSSFGARRKPVELVGVTVEVPPRRMNGNFEDESAAESPASQGFRSPMMGRMLSFTRILSRERRAAAPVSPAASCAESVAELDVERGREGTH